MRITIAAVLCGLMLTGCAIQRTEIASRAQTELVGMSKKDLLLCAGVPLRQERAEDLEFLTFAGGGDSVGSAVATSTSPSTAVAVGKSAHRYCEATFALKNGFVQKVNYQGRTGGASHERGAVRAHRCEMCQAVAMPNKRFERDAPPAARWASPRTHEGIYA